MLITRPMMAFGVCAWTSAMFRFTKNPAFQPVMNIISSAMKYHGASPRATFSTPPAISVHRK